MADLDKILSEATPPRGRAIRMDISIFDDAPYEVGSNDIGCVAMRPIALDIPEGTTNREAIRDALLDLADHWNEWLGTGLDFTTVEEAVENMPS